MMHDPREFEKIKKNAIRKYGTVSGPVYTFGQSCQTLKNILLDEFRPGEYLNGITETNYTITNFTATSHATFSGKKQEEIRLLYLEPLFKECQSPQDLYDALAILSSVIDISVKEYRLDLRTLLFSDYLRTFVQSTLQGATARPPPFDAAFDNESEWKPMSAAPASSILAMPTIEK
jgi:hypothetical protein